MYKKMRDIRLAVLRLTLCSTSLALVAVLSACEQGSYFDPNTKQLKSDAVGRVEATGTDFRVYEFTPQTAPGKQCIFVAATDKGGLFCFDKASAGVTK